MNSSVVMSLMLVHDPRLTCCFSLQPVVKLAFKELLAGKEKLKEEEKAAEEIHALCFLQLQDPKTSVAYWQLR
jgi:hypothetical protein